MTRVNCRLKVRQEDEVLFYQAEKNNLDVEECKGILCLQPINSDKVEAGSVDDLWKEIYEECFLVSRYKDVLLNWDRFNFLIENILEKAEICNKKLEAVALMEQMLLRSEEYLWIEEAGCPVLLYKSDDVCHNVLNIFAEQLGAAFERAGQEVEYFDTETEEINDLNKFRGRHFRAVIGMQTYLFGVRMMDGSYLHDYIIGPKFNFIFDHPVWMRHHLTNVPKNFYVITHDINYVQFTQHYYHHKTYLLPLAGQIVTLEDLREIYDISFIGTYGDYWNQALLIHEMPREIRFIANHFLLELRKNTNYTAEEALAEVYRKKGYQPTDEEFLEMLWELYRPYFCAVYYYRHCVIKSLLDAGLRVDVFGETWQTSPLSVYPNLVCHPNVRYEEAVRIWQQSKMSLNIMSWHKGGFTERMANIMLCKTVLVTDDTSYLHGRYASDEDLIVFRLDELKTLPQKLKMYLENEEKRHGIAERGWRKACCNETWDVRERILEEVLL